MFGEQDPFRRGVLGQGKESWVRKGFTKEFAVLRMNRSLPGGDVWGARAKAEEVQVTERDVCKVQRLEISRCVGQLQVFQYCSLERKGRRGT